MSFGAPFPASGRSEISLLEQSMREKDNIIQAQYAELVELRRQHELALEGVKHWREKAIRFNPQLDQEPRAQLAASSAQYVGSAVPPAAEEAAANAMESA